MATANNKKTLYTSAVLVYDKENDLVLAVSRKIRHDLFGFPGGKLEHGETFCEAAVRELKEETGLEATVMKPVLDMIHTGEKMLYHCVVYRAEVVGSIHTTEKGVVAWVKPKVLVDGPFGDLSQCVFDLEKIKY